MRPILFLILYILIGVPAQSVERPLSVSVQTFDSRVYQCEKAVGCDFYTCSQDKILYFPGIQAGISPTLHSLDLSELQVPLRVSHRGFKYYENSNLFQYYLNPQPEATEGPGTVGFFRNYGLMMQFYPSLMSCQDSKLKRFVAKVNAIMGPQKMETPMQDVERLVLRSQFQSAAEDFVSFEDLSDYFQEWLKRDNFALGELRDGCYARAHLLGAGAQAKKISAKKVWMHGFGLWPSGEIRPERFFSWRYHVGLLVPTVVNGKVRLMVLDPSTSLAPQLLVDWAQKINGPNKGVTYVARVDDREAANSRLTQLSVSDVLLYPEWSNFPRGPLPVSFSEYESSLAEAQNLLKDLDDAASK